MQSVFCRIDRHSRSKSILGTAGPGRVLHYFASGRSVDSFTAGYIDSSSRITPIWNQWFEEVITYNPATGRMTVSVNGGTPVLFSGSLPPNRFGSACMPMDGVRGMPIWSTVFGLSGLMQAMAPARRTASAPHDLNGVWTEQTGLPNAVAVIFQEGNDVRLISTYEYQGKRIVWHGVGKKNGNRVTLTYHYTTTRDRPDGKTAPLSSRSLLTVSALSGTARTAGSGRSSAMQFKRTSIRHE